MFRAIDPGLQVHERALDSAMCGVFLPSAACLARDRGGGMIPNVMFDGS